MFISTSSKDGMNQMHPKNPQIHRPVIVVGKDVQPPRKQMHRAPVKGGKQPRKHISHKVQEKELYLQEELKSLIDTDLVWWL